MMPWSAKKNLIFGASEVEVFLRCAEADNGLYRCFGAPDKVDGVFRGTLEVGGTGKFSLREARDKASEQGDDKKLGDGAV